jgi:hypothetical protein
MSRIANDLVLDVLVALPLQCLVQLPACFRRTDDIISALNDDDGKVFEYRRCFNQLPIFHPAAIDEEMAFDPCESECPGRMVSMHAEPRDEGQHTIEGLPPS